MPLTALAAVALATAPAATASDEVGPNEWGYELITPADGRSNDLYGMGVSSDMAMVATSTYNIPLPGSPADGRNLTYLYGVPRRGAPWPMGEFDFRNGPQLTGNTVTVGASGDRVLYRGQIAEPGSSPRPIAPGWGGGGLHARTPDLSVFAIREAGTEAIYIVRDGQQRQLGSKDAAGNPVPADRITDSIPFYEWSGLSGDASSVIYSTEHSFAGDNDNGHRDVIRQILTPGAERTIVISDATSGSGADGAADADFRWATADHSRIFFTTSESLDPGDVDAAQDLYMREGDAPPVWVSKGEIIDGVQTGNASLNATWARASLDGRRVYFSTQEQLTVDAPPNNSQKVYERDVAEGRTRLVGVFSVVRETNFVSNPDPSLTNFRVAGDGVVFQTTASLTPDATGVTGSKIYRWTRGGGLEWISKPAPGAPMTTSAPTGASFVAQIVADLGGSEAWRTSGGRSVTDDGTTVFFTTRQSLVAEDTDEGKKDVYRWKEGEGLSLVSLPGRAQYDSSYLDSSPDGTEVYINTNENILPEDFDPNAADIYLAILGGGKRPGPPPPDRDPVVCEGDACQGPVSPPPTLPNIGSITFGGDGNVPLVPDPVRVSVGVTKLKSVTGSAAKLKVRVPDAGRVSVAGSSIRRTGVSASKAGSYTVKIALSSKAKRTLKQRKTLKVSARVSFRAKDGQSAAKTISVTFKQPKGKRAKARKGGR